MSQKTKINIKNDVIVHLEQFAGLVKGNKPDAPYSSMYDFVLKEGERFEPRPFDEAAFPGADRAKKDCYANAYHMSLLYDLDYIEGYAVSSAGIPLAMMHAWCADEDSNLAIDPTWDHMPGMSYYGVRFRSDYMIHVTGKRGYYGVIDAWELRWPLLSGEHTREQYLKTA